MNKETLIKYLELAKDGFDTSELAETILADIENRVDRSIKIIKLIGNVFAAIGSISLAAIGVWFVWQLIL